MHHNRDDRYDYKRRDYREERDIRGNHPSSRRNRWDEKGSKLNYSPNSSNSREEAHWEESGSSSNWQSERQYSFYSKAGDRKRSRSRSPFGRNFRDGANPTKDEYACKTELSDHSLKGSDTHQSNSSRKNTSWSDSSDDESQPAKFNPRASWEDRKSSQRHYEDERKTANVSSTNAKSSPTDGEEIRSSSLPGISLKLAGSSTAKSLPLPKVISVPIPVKSSKVAAIFNVDDDDDEPEEMPPECKMRMKNVGRETKTSEGPNSFGKTKIGFCNMSHLAEKLGDEKAGAIKKP